MYRDTFGNKVRVAANGYLGGPCWIKIIPSCYWNFLKYNMYLPLICYLQGLFWRQSEPTFKLLFAGISLEYISYLPHGNYIGLAFWRDSPFFKSAIGRYTCESFQAVLFSEPLMTVMSRKYSFWILFQELLVVHFH